MDKASNGDAEIPPTTKRCTALRNEVEEFRKKIWTSRNLASEIDAFLEKVADELQGVEDELQEMASGTGEAREKEKELHVEEFVEAMKRVFAAIETPLEDILKKPDAQLRCTLQEFSRALREGIRFNECVKGEFPSLALEHRLRIAIRSD